MTSEKDPSRERLARLLAFLREHRRAVIAAQNRPDPDGMASAAALKRILREKAGLEVVIAASGKSGRAENLATLQFLGETLEDLECLDLAAFDLRALVDTQPGFANNSWPAQIPLHLVIDHHPRTPGIAQDSFADIRTDYGATSTILTEYLRAAHIEPDPQLATALLYGIKTDTLDLSRGASPADIAAFLYLYPLANQRLLGKIERERLPRGYFVTLARALHDCRIYNKVALCAVGPVASPDALAELADFFLRIEGVHWVLCHGLCEGQLHLSVRTTLRQGNAGSLVAAMLEGIGHGGGHDMLAGGQATLADLDPKAIDALGHELELRFLRLLEVPTRTPEHLVPEPEEHNNDV
jgi:nanoRNase/pAp phosphatase (c-di-AMP/oligoRNAs hydrolase)